MMELDEIAKEIGVTRQAAGQILERAMRKFRWRWLKMFGRPVFEPTEQDQFVNIALMNYAKGVRREEMGVITEDWEES